MNVFSILLKACGVAVICCVCLTLIGKLAPTYAVVLRVGGAVALFCILLYLLAENVSSVLDFASSLLGGELSLDLLTLMLKALGMAVVARLCADICRDCGEGTLASVVEGVGKAAIFTLAIPLFSKILGIAVEIMGLS